MTFEKYCQRSDLIGTQVITRNSGRRLGVVSQLWVDVDQREVVAIGVRESMLSGVLSNTQKAMMLTSVRQIGDVILVDDETVLEDPVTVETYSTLISSEVITETGDLLGKVRGFKFNTEDGRVESIVIASIGLPQIPDQLISTYELSMDEVVSSGPDRLIVFEGAEDKLNQLSVGVLERIGIGKPPWEREDEEEYIAPISTPNQLPSGIQTPVEPIRARPPIAAQETWDEDNWNEAQPRRQLRQMREPEPTYAEPAYPEPAPRYAEAEQGNWDDDDDYDTNYDDRPTPARSADYQLDEDVTSDAWADGEEEREYRPPQVNIPERKRVVEYEEETDY